MLPDLSALRKGSVEQAGELREAKKRLRLLEQENEVLRRARCICRRRICRENDLPARP
jgi:transposase-like protein